MVNEVRRNFTNTISSWFVPMCPDKTCSFICKCADLYSAAQLPCHVPVKSSNHQLTSSDL